MCEKLQDAKDFYTMSMFTIYSKKIMFIIYQF
jgi:hypothetical protein